MNKCRNAFKLLALSLLLMFVAKFWNREPIISDSPKAVVLDDSGNSHVYDSRTHPVIFIGGHPRSGTTLMRALLDSHSMVRCGEETRVIPRLLQMRDNWLKSEQEVARLEQAGISGNVIDSGLTAFIMEIIAKHGAPAKVLCNKDPLTLKQGKYMTELFPKAKWIFMVRDGRAVIHSVITRKVTISGYNLKSPRQCLDRWNTIIENMDAQCKSVGPEKCMVVYYEQLVLHPQRWLTIILEFLDLPWDESVMHHQDFINKEGKNGIRVSAKERSSDQIVKPINVEALTTWVGFYPEDVLKDMDSIAPMLAKLGYSPTENPPNYGVPDGQVVNNTRDVQENRDFWEIRSKQMVAEMEKKKEDDKA